MFQTNNTKELKTQGAECQGLDLDLASPLMIRIDLDPRSRVARPYTGCVRKNKLYNVQFLIAEKINKAQQQHCLRWPKT